MENLLEAHLPSTILGQSGFIWSNHGHKIIRKPYYAVNIGSEDFLRMTYFLVIMT